MLERVHGRFREPVVVDARYYGRALGVRPVEVWRLGVDFGFDDGHAVGGRG